MAAEPAPVGQPSTVRDEHRVLLWQTCAYAEELAHAARGGRSVTAPHLALVDFARHRLLPYLTDEERRLPATQLRDEHMGQLVRSDHARLRADVDNIESAWTGRLRVLAAEALVGHLDRHVQREELWMPPGPAGSSSV